MMLRRPYSLPQWVLDGLQSGSVEGIAYRSDDVALVHMSYGDVWCISVAATPDVMARERAASDGAMVMRYAARCVVERRNTVGMTAGWVV